MRRLRTSLWWTKSTLVHGNQADSFVAKGLTFWSSDLQTTTADLMSIRCSKDEPKRVCFLDDTVPDTKAPASRFKQDDCVPPSLRDETYESSFDYSCTEICDSSEEGTCLCLDLSQTQRSSLREIEVLPGQFMLLRGAEETWRAVHRDFFLPTQCSCCRETLFCIQDADYILCPTCRVVSPFPGRPSDSGDSGGGVGLGFDLEQLGRWQGEISRASPLGGAR